ncbi:uncharacterized protein LOC133196652 [Saccostrea echinata]|uniref:uncharacterized protein LOC133196652 n=1 Tax=Saccostrea echinata TaxID=191078 RepID=UPI002A7ECC11|nr:uncharacterized protein LOC133196652 [Saccostrea echinata]
MIYKYILELLLDAALVFGRDNFYPVRSCTEVTLAEIPLDLLKTCAEKKDFIIHCLSENTNEEMGLSCFTPIWIDQGECPYFNNYQGNLDARACMGTQCATKTFSSPLSVEYKGCYPKELLSTVSATTTSVMKQSTPQNATTDMMRLSTSEPLTNGSQDNCCEEEPCLPETIVSIVISIFLTGFIFVMFWHKTFYEGIRGKLCEIIGSLCLRSEDDDPHRRDDEIGHLKPNENVI